MVFDYESIPALLAAELRRRVQNNPNYSLRSFARHLRVSPGALSEILKGRRDLSLRSVPSVAKAIGLSAGEAQHLLRLAQNAKTAKAGGAPDAPVMSADQRLLSEQIFSLISEWYHFAILNLLECEDFQWSATWIAARLEISRLQAKMAMELLLNLKLVTKKAGQYVGAGDHILSTSEIPSAAIRGYHRQILEKAIRALDAQSVGERDISGVGMALDPAHLPAIKKEIAEFQDRLLAKYARGKKKEVYFLETALFKLTHDEKKNGDQK